MAWVSALCDYLELRKDRVNIDDPAALLQWLRLQHLRAKIPAGRRDRRQKPDAFGMQHPPQEKLLDWHAPFFSAVGQPLGTARIESVGREALTLALPFDLKPDHRYKLQLQTGAQQHATLLIWPLWQAKIQVNRWRIGAIVLSVAS